VQTFDITKRKRTFPSEINTLGDYLWQKRLELGLLQKEVAWILKTNFQNVSNWETNSHEIAVEFRPRVIDFIGFCPYGHAAPLTKRLKQVRESLGLTQEKLAAILKIDESTIAKWERGDYQPTPKYVQIIKSFFQFGADAASLRHWRQTISNQKLKSVRLEIPAFVWYEANWMINQKLAAWRRSYGLSLRAIASLIGVHPQTWLRWEQGKRKPSPRNLTRILKFLSTFEFEKSQST
jgi:transcriptional regulator with XRE-family HTH domain